MKQYSWTKGDLEPTKVDWPLMHTIPNDLNRISKSPMMTKDKLRKMNRGTYDSLMTEGKSSVVAKWYDNNIVTIASNAVPVLSLQRAKRFSETERKYIHVPQPSFLKVYNSGMRGVDRFDQNVSLYRTSIRGEKWCFALITHTILMCVSKMPGRHI